MTLSRIKMFEIDFHLVLRFGPFLEMKFIVVVSKIEGRMSVIPADGKCVGTKQNEKKS